MIIRFKIKKENVQEGEEDEEDNDNDKVITFLMKILILLLG